MACADLSSTLPQAEGDSDGNVSPGTPSVVSLTPLLLTIRQVGLIVGISERKLRGMVSAGQFPKPVGRLGRMSRWKRSAVEEWVATLS